MGRRMDALMAEIHTLLSARNAPMSAYEILGALTQSERRLAPTTLYRALAALIDRREIHRLESRNAFVACRRDCARETAIFSICDDCGAVEENVSTEVMAALADAARESGFAPSRHVIEVLGVCGVCRSAGAAR